MPRTIARPVMWTYLIAMGIATLLIAATQLTPSRAYAFVMMAFLLGQLWLLATWAAVGHAPRLIRGLGLMLGLLLYAAIICHLEQHRSIRHLRGELGSVLIIATPAFIAALLTKVLLDWRNIGPSQRFHFQMKEIFAWMAIIAASSWMLDASDFGLLEMDPTFATLLTAGIAAGFVGAICHREAIPTYFKVVATVLTVAAVAGCLWLASVVPAPRFNQGAIGGGIYLIVAFILRGYDDRNFGQRLAGYRRDQKSFALGEHD